eukprot:COSAG02_NODE_9384_length_2234_cov_15.604372_1_plen_166_part_00
MPTIISAKHIPTTSIAKHAPTNRRWRRRFDSCDVRMFVPLEPASTSNVPEVVAFVASMFPVIGPAILYRPASPLQLFPQRDEYAAAPLLLGVLWLLGRVRPPTCHLQPELLIFSPQCRLLLLGSHAFQPLSLRLALGSRDLLVASPKIEANEACRAQQTDRLHVL